MQLSSQVADRSLLNRLDFIWYDWRMWLSAHYERLPQTTPIVIADIDEQSLTREGRWPWSRYKLALLTERLTQAGAVVIAFDVVFAEPEESAFIAWLKQQPANDPAVPQIEALSEQWNPDRRFAQALQGTDTVLGFFFQDSAENRSGQLPPSVASLADPTGGQGASVMLNQAGFTANIPLIANGADRGGFVTTFADADGVIRRTPLLMAHKGQVYPSLALAAAMSFMLVEELDVRLAAIGEVLAVSAVQLSDKPIYTDGLGRVLVPYHGQPAPVRYLPAWRIFSEPPEQLGLDGAIVLVGGSAIGLFDLVNTPLATAFPGVEVHANVLHGLLASRFPYRPAWEPGVTFCQLLLTGLLLIVLMPRRSPWLQAGLSFGALAGWTGLNLFLWMRNGLDLPLAGTYLLVLALAGWFMFEGFVRESRARQAITSMFGQYVPSGHIQQMLTSPQSYSMDGQSREMTVLFSDIRSFTSISENLSAADLKTLLNYYFTPITEVIFRHGGTIDKYVGDMVMAFWGAPLIDPDHRRNAVLAALEMIAVTERLRGELHARNMPEIVIGIGLNTGFMNVGDMGSQYRKAYTVLGDAVNLGSRLESLTKFYGVHVLVGANTVSANADIAFRFVDRVLVKGKNEPVEAFEPLGLIAELSAAQREELEQYDDALQHYRTRRWELAEQGLQQLRSVHPQTKLYRIYLERIRELREQQLPADWDGTFHHISK
ncbi:MAG TPA: adenylate/guanylate cyclase domain-containing protein [Pseudomonas sp.]|nr:adenylate/guanylate cyclase domain-containing protein [Pseudomonas sp.]